jgi:hypothetical protein
MPQDAIDYRHPTTTPAHHHAWRIAVLCIASALLAVSVGLCVWTWNTPGRIIFLPFVDAWFGFRSHGGWLDWVSYAPWRQGRDHLVWFLPWAAPILVEMAVIALCLYRRRSNV